MWPYTEILMLLLVTRIPQAHTQQPQKVFMCLLPVLAATAPIRTEGIDSRIQPKPPTTDRVWAVPAVLEDRTRWKYACHGIPPHIL